MRVHLIDPKAKHDLAMTRCVVDYDEISCILDNLTYYAVFLSGNSEGIIIPKKLATPVIEKWLDSALLP